MVLVGQFRCCEPCLNVFMSRVGQSAFKKSCLTPLSGGELELPATARSALTDGDLLCLALGEVTALAPQIFRTGLAGRYNTNIEGAALRLCILGCIMIDFSGV